MKILIIGAISCFIINSGVTMLLTGTFNRSTHQTSSPAEEETVMEGTPEEGKEQESAPPANDGASELEILQAKLEGHKVQIAEAETKLNSIKAEVESLNVLKSSLTRSQQLAKLYSSMKPDSVALILCEMEADLSIQILTQMNDRASAKVMDAITELDPDYAAEISKFMANTRGT